MSTRRWLGLTVGLAAALYLVEQPLANLLFEGLSLSRTQYNWAVQIVATALLLGASWRVASWKRLRGPALAWASVLATIATQLIFTGTGWLIPRLPISWELLVTQPAHMVVAILWAIEAVVMAQLVTRAFNSAPARLTSAST